MCFLKMGYLCILVLILVVAIIIKIIGYIRRLFEISPLPYLEDTWWGSRNKSEEDTFIKPFTINIPENIIEDLQYRLKNTKSLTEPLEGVQHHYGINTKLLNKIIEFWRTEYNWREREKFLKKFPQFTVSIQGLRLHYIHVKPSNPDGFKTLPLLLLHGWGGSIREFYEIIPLLTSPRTGYNFVFEVIVPSLPGYGFSEATGRPGLGVVQMAVIFKNFMNRLGFSKYYIQGGDWGAMIVQHMATLFPEQILGLHSNLCFVNSFLSNMKLILYSFWPTLLTDKEHVNKIYPLSTKFVNTLLETGYMHIQATKPDTIGVALNDSPVGLAAYILEKFITWTNPEWKNLENGGLTEKYTYTNLLDNIMIYWVTKSITTSMRLYAESFNKDTYKISLIPTNVPTACARFSHELVYLPKAILKEKYRNIVHESDHEGGHFAAFENPEILAEDIFIGMQKIELFHKNKNRNL